MFRLIQLSDDNFHYLLSWLDVGCLCKLDIAMGNAYERSLWLNSLHTMDSKSLDEYEHTHDSIWWLMRRGARATQIRIRRTRLEHDRITDQTFIGICDSSTLNTDTDGRNDNMNNSGAVELQSHSTVRNRLKNSDITTDTSTCTLVRRWGCPHLTSIDLSGCNSISDIGILALAEGCHQLTSINLRDCRSISDIGISALAEGCHHLTSIDLSDCNSISDIGVSALAEGCHQLTSINLPYCYSISDIGVSALAEGCHQLTSINLNCCRNISDTGVLALAEGCHQLTSINLSNCHGISDIDVLLLLLNKNYPLLHILISDDYDNYNYDEDD